MDIDEMVKDLTNYMQAIQGQIDMLIDHTDLIEETFERFIPGTAPRFIITEIDQLTAARKALKIMLGPCKYDFKQSFFSCGDTHTIWESNGQKIELWFSCKLEDFPESLKGKKCNWEATERRELDYNLVCPS